MLRFAPLASSSSGCSYHLSGGGASAPLLIDAGLTMAELKRRTNFGVGSLAGCLVSHAHGDHNKAAKDLVYGGVPVYASEETLHATGIDGNYWARQAKAGERFRAGEWDVLPFDAVHDEPGTLGFLVGSPEGDRLLYLTDSAYSLHRFEGLTHIAIECNHSDELVRANAIAGHIDMGRAGRVKRTHMSLERLIDMLGHNDLSRVEEIWLLHLSDANSDEAAFKTAVQRATGFPVYVAPANGHLDDYAGCGY